MCIVLALGRFRCGRCRLSQGVTALFGRTSASRLLPSFWRALEGTIHQRCWQWAYAIWSCLSRLLKERFFFSFFFFFDGKLFLLGHRAFKIPFSISSSLTTPNDEIKILFQCKYFFDSFSKFFILSCTNSTYPYFPSAPFFSFFGDILTLHSFPPHPFYEPT